MDNKLDMGFHCVRPTEIGNAISELCFPLIPWSSWEEKASFASQDQVCLSYSLLKNGLSGAEVEVGVTYLLQNSLPMGWLFSKPSWYPVFLKRDLLSCLQLPCRDDVVMVGSLSCLGMPKEGLSFKNIPLFYGESLVPSIYIPSTQTLTISPSNPDSLLSILFLIRKKEFT